MIEFTYLESLCLYCIITAMAIMWIYFANNVTSLAQQHLTLACAYLTITIPAAIRYNVGIDQRAYIGLYEFFSKFSSVEEALKWHTVERTFAYGCVISKELFNSPVPLFAFYAIFTHLLILLGIWNFKRYINPVAAMFIYMTGFYWRTYNLFRQSLAIAIIFYAVKWIDEKKYFRFIVACLIATMFHKSSIVAILGIPYFRRKKINIIDILLPALIVILIRPLSQLLFSINLLENYSLNYKVNFLGIEAYLRPGTVLQVGMLTVFLIYSRRINETIKNDFIYTLCYRSMLMAFISYLLMFVLDAGVRILLYFSTFNIFGIAALYCDSSYEVRKGEISKSGFIMVLYGLWIFYSMVEADSYGIFPYILWKFW